nr:PQQ-dependent sugar dehydrogenase [Palleronia aestuarii]
MGCAQTAPSGAPVEQGPKNAPQFEPAFENQTRAPAIDSEMRLVAEPVVEGLVHPWGIEVLPDGGYLVTERAGQLRIVRDGEAGGPIANVPDVLSQGQGGLLDVALAEDFSETRRIYLTYAKPMPGGMSATAAATGVLNAEMTELSEVQEIFQQEPPSAPAKHFGSRIVLDGDHAFITTGEHSSMETRVYAQDLDKTYGKIVRISLDDYTAPDDNPFVGQDGAIDMIWSTGHRNIQGAAMRPGTGELWGLEHGPAGGDELNLIEPGENYGWPVVSYGEQYSGGPIGSGEPRAEGFVEPRYYWDPVIAPGGFLFYEGEMFSDWEGDVLASSLSPGGLVRLTLDGDTVTGEERFLGNEGRIRDVAIDRDGAILLLTDYDNGAVLRVTPADPA